MMIGAGAVLDGIGALGADVVSRIRREAGRFAAGAGPSCTDSSAGSEWMYGVSAEMRLGCRRAMEPARSRSNVTLVEVTTELL